MAEGPKTCFELSVLIAFCIDKVKLNSFIVHVSISFMFLPVFLQSTIRGLKYSIVLDFMYVFFFISSSVFMAPDVDGPWGELYNSLYIFNENNLKSVSEIESGYATA